MKRFFVNLLIVVHILASGFTCSLWANTIAGNTGVIIEINNDIDLKRKTISLPEGSVLRFLGGRYLNGTIIGNSSSIEAQPQEIFADDVTILGDWNVDRAYVEWFGAVACDDNDAIKYAVRNGRAIQKCVDVFAHILFANGSTTKKYYVAPEKGKDYIINISKRGRIIEGKDVDRTVLITPRNVKNTKILFFSEPSAGARASDCLVQNLKIKHQDSNSFANTGIFISYKCSGIRLIGIHLEQLDICVKNESWTQILKRVKCYGNYGFVFESPKGYRTSVSMEDCTVCNATVGYILKDLLYSNLVSCGADCCDLAFDLKNCSVLGFQSCGTEDCRAVMNVESCKEITINMYAILTKAKADEYAFSKADIRKYFSITGNSSQIVFANCLFSIHKASSLKKISDDELAIFTAVRSNGASLLLTFRDCSGSFEETGTPFYNLICVDERGGKYFDRQSVVLENCTFTSGNASRRPKLNALFKGYQYFDTDLGKPIWYKGDGIWVDATGKQI